ncbi:DUF6502 family protein [Pseudomonas putida]|uniref:Uncharacterized protein n=2 Tax=Pseudomonas putida group TaxID=136845 RepID=A0A2N1ISC3_9PSED|nr:MULTISPECIES: DUF6502 family protein [Pseudomonas]EKT4455594.1 hypothetical protein [Pseudomonas putida]EKT4471039.1 hypothetical protein [Pseudomonas putida]EKT4495499.1 hypothetical protein [Pseudomonas putida]EKT4512928.1 hypothetical protein [Pseudomonas putida]EKT4531874.1 hypothetical protein [Pseudomonas putida]
MQSPVLPPSMLSALRRVMRPLVRLMLRKGVTYTMFTDLLKEVFVDVAHREFRLNDTAPTDSRISLLTGVHRKDVRRLRNEGDTARATLPDNITLGAQLVNVWTNTPPFCSAPGQARALARLASVGGDCSFDALVARVSTDIRGRVVLDEWLRLGVVRLDEQDCVHLEAHAFVPQKGFDEKAAYFGHNLHDHACAAVHNLSGEGQPFFERSVHYDALSPASVEHLRDVVAKDGMQTLLAFSRLAAELESVDEPGIEQRQRITVGLYFYTEATDSDPSKTPGP